MAETTCEYDKAFKDKAIAFAKLYNCCAAAGKFNVGESLVREWLKSDVIANGPYDFAPKWGRGLWSELEESVSTWVIECRKRGMRVTREKIRKHALEWARANPDKSKGFSATESWCRRFVERKNLKKRGAGVASKGEQEVVLIDEDSNETKKAVREGEAKKKLQMPCRERSPLQKRTIKKPKMMEQFITFSDCSELEDNAEHSSDYELSDEDSSNQGVVYITEEMQQSINVKDSWSGSPVPDEVTIEEVKPMLEVYLDTDVMESLKTVKDENSEQNPYVGSTSELEPTSIVEAEINSNTSVDHEFLYSMDKESSTASPGSSQLFEIGQVGRLSTVDFDKMQSSLEKKKKSPVWKHFTRCGFETAVCNYCAASIKTPRGSTSSMARHLLTHVKHKKGESGYKYTDCVLTSESILNMPGKPSSTGQPEKDKEFQSPVTEKVAMSVDRFKVITERLAFMMIEGYQTPSLVQDAGFRALINELEPKYQMPSKSYFSNVYIPDLYKKACEKAKKKYSPVIRDAKFCSLTVDTWTSIYGASHLAISCHHMSEDFQIVHQFLRSEHFPGKQCGQEMLQVIQSVLKEWEVKDEVQLHVVTDCSRDLGAAASKSSWVMVQCFAHSLQLAILGAKAYTPDYGDVIQRVRDLAWRYSTCPAARKDLKDVQTRKDVPRDDILQDHGEGGSWNSEYQMAKRFVEQKEAIQDELEGKKDAQGLSDGDWELLEEVVSVLKPIDEAMKDFCAQTYPPLSMTIPIIYGIEHMLTMRIEEKGVCNLSTFSRNLLKGVRSRFPSYKTNRTSLLAMVLDPRYKAVILTEPEMNLVAKMLADEIGGASSASPTKGQGSDKTPKEGPPGVTSTPSLWSAFEKVSKELPPVSEKKLALYQVKQYIDESVIARTSDPLAWWVENRERYDLIAPLAKKYESIPATQVKGSALIASSPEGIVEDRRRYLTGPNVEQLVFLHENL